MKFRIDDEIRRYMPSARKETDEELARQLKETSGPVDAIRVWKEEGVIVDGHRRVSICEELGIPYEHKIEYLNFPTREAVFAWMDSWALARRNLSDQDYRFIVTRMAERRKAAGDKMGEILSDASDKTGKSERTIRRDLKMEEAFRSLPDDIEQSIRSGEVKARNNDILTLAGLCEDHQRAVIREWESGEYKHIGEIIGGDDSESLDSPSDSTGGENSSPPPPKSMPEVLKELCVLARRRNAKVTEVADSIQKVSPSGRHAEIFKLLNRVDKLFREWCGVDDK